MKNKIKTILKNIINYKHFYLLLTTIIGLIIISTIYILQKVAPFGKNSLLTVDFFHQYGPMLSELYDRIKNGNNLIYSFNAGLGIPFFRNYFNYLSSPINLIMLLFKRKDLLMSYSVIIGIKSILSAITCGYFLKKKFNTNQIYLIGLSVLYSYSAYFTAYYWNIMWIDGLYFLPLITLGIENIINKNNGLLYTISLSLMLYTNYFIGYMICIYSCLYFILYLIIKTNTIKDIKYIFKKILKFGICSLTAGLLMAFELIPMYQALRTTNATMGTIPTEQYYAFTLIEFLKNHITGVTSTVFASGISNCPNISCGILSIALLILFIINKKINLKRKIIYTLFLIILLASFYIAPLDYVWHAFHVPNDLPYRYSFIYTFILIIISAYSLKNIKKTNIIQVSITYVICLILITFVLKTNYENITNNMITINYLLITTYFLIYILNHYFPRYNLIASLIFISVCTLECIITINHNWNISQNIKDFYNDYYTINSNIKNIKQNEKDKFYRTEKTSILTFNDGDWYNYYSTGTFSSMAYDKIAKLTNDLGEPGNNINSYYYKQNTPIYDIMFNIKYIIGPNIDNKRYNLIDSKDIDINKFNYNIGLMFGVNNNIKDWNNNYINPLEYQNDFVNYTTNIENIFNRLPLYKKEIISKEDNETIVKYTYKNNQDNIYMYSNNSLVNYIIFDNNLYYKNKVDINNIQLKLNKNIYNSNNYDESYVINEKSNNEYIEIYVSYKNYLYEEIDIYSMDNDKFIKAYDIFKNNNINITDFKENNIKGKINLKEDKTIYTSIPYDKGWKVYNNGKEISTFKINDSLLGFDLKKGNNKIELKYITHNIDLGISISISTLIASISYLLIKKKKINHQD